MRKRFASALVVLALSAVTGTWAQTAATRIVPGVAAPVASPAAPPPARWTVAQLQQSFAAADSDGNGELTRAEAQQLLILPRNFEELDANKDGLLSRAEYESMARQ